MISSKQGGMNFTRSLLDIKSIIKILPNVVFDCHHIEELQPLLIELCLANGLVRKPHGILVVDVKITKELSQAPIILGRLHNHALLIAYRLDFSV